MTVKDKIRFGTATYHEAHQYSVDIGQILAEVFQENLSSDMLPHGRMYYNIAQKVIDPMMVENFNLVAENTVQIQELLNNRAGISIAGQYPTLNQDRIDGLIQRLADEEVFDNIKWILGDPIVNFSQSIVDDTLKANADFHYKSGLNPKIRRTVSGHKPCEWCRKIAGVYDYPVSNMDVYRRHKKCRCETEYDPGDGKTQNVWDKTWR